jgi:hypothetical protein
MEGLLLPLVVIVAVAVSLARGLGKIPTLKGKLGEWQVKSVLRRSLPPDEYTLLHNVTIPSREGTTQIDHVVVSRFGIFVIETKNLSGWIFGSDRDSHWTQTFRRSKPRFQNPLRQNYAHVRALESLLGLPASVFHSVVVFTGTAEFKTPMPPNVTRLGGLSRFIRGMDVPVLRPDELPPLVERIETGRLAPGRATDEDHVASLKERHAAVGGLVGDARKLVRTASGTFLLVRFVVAGVALGVFYLIVVNLLGGVKEILFPRTAPVAAVTQPAQPRPVTPANSTISRPPSGLFQGTNALLEKVKADALARRQELEKSRYEAWEASLLCAHSIDTDRCACYDPKGPKADIPVERCIALANKGTVLAQ